MVRQRHSSNRPRQEPGNKNNGTRAMGQILFRENDDQDSRRRIISFSSETPYTRWFGVEILDHADGAVDLSRLNQVGVLLFNHDTDVVLGKVIRAWVENGRGMAEVEFDTDDDAEKIFGKVKSGTLKTTSVRYSVDAWEEGDDLLIEGNPDLTVPEGLVFNSHGDHRLAMTWALVGACGSVPVNVTDFTCVAVSYPDFLADLKELVR